MAVLEAVAVGLGIHLGKKAIDWIWGSVQQGEAPIISQNGTAGYTTGYGARTMISQDFTVTPDQESELVIGNFYLPRTLSDIIYDEVPLVLIVDEYSGHTLFFPADLDQGYAVYLPHGVYSFFVFLMDRDEDDMMDAFIYAVGFASMVNLTDASIEEINVDEHDDIWDLVIADPIELGYGGPFTMDFILIDTDVVPELPMFLSELM